MCCNNNVKSLNILKSFSCTRERNVWSRKASFAFKTNLKVNFNVCYSLYLLVSGQIGFYLHANENQFSYERMSTRTPFEKEVKGNSEMAYRLSC